MNCDMTVAGKGCGAPAWGGIHMTDPFTDRITDIRLACLPCAIALMENTDTCFRVVDLDMSVRIRQRWSEGAG